MTGSECCTSEFMVAGLSKLADRTSGSWRPNSISVTWHRGGSDVWRRQQGMPRETLFRWRDGGDGTRGVGRREIYKDKSRANFFAAAMWRSTRDARGWCVDIWEASGGLGRALR